MDAPVGAGVRHGQIICRGGHRRRAGVPIPPPRPSRPLRPLGSIDGPAEAFAVRRADQPVLARGSPRPIEMTHVTSRGERSLVAATHCNQALLLDRRVLRTTGRAPIQLSRTGWDAGQSVAFRGNLESVSRFGAARGEGRSAELRSERFQETASPVVDPGATIPHRQVSGTRGGLTTVLRIVSALPLEVEVSSDSMTSSTW